MAFVKSTLLLLTFSLSLQANLKELWKGTVGLFDESYKFNNNRAENLKPISNYDSNDSEKNKLVFLILGDQGTGKKNNGSF